MKNYVDFFDHSLKLLAYILEFKSINLGHYFFQFDFFSIHLSRKSENDFLEKFAKKPNKLNWVKRYLLIFKNIFV